MEKWEDLAFKAAGERFLCVSADQRTHLRGIEDDPIAIWKKLESVHLQKRPGARFNAWNSFFGVQKKEDESLSQLMTRIESNMQEVQNLRPEGMTLAQMDEELVCMMMVRSLPSEYDSFASSFQLLDKFEKSKLQEAFVAEETRKAHSQPSLPASSSSTTAL